MQNQEVCMVSIKIINHSHSAIFVQFEIVRDNCQLELQEIISSFGYDIVILIKDLNPGVPGTLFILSAQI